MNSQIELVRPDGSGRRRITPGGATNNWLNCWTPDGSAIMFSSNMDDDASMDCYRFSMETGETERIAVNSGTGVVEHVARRLGTQLLVNRVVYRGDNNIYLAASTMDEERLLTAHEPPSSFGNARFSYDASSVYMRTNRDHDLASFVRVPLAPWRSVGNLADARKRRAGAIRHLGGRPAGGAGVEHAGRHELELINLAENRAGAKIDLPGEIVDSLRFSPMAPSWRLPSPARRCRRTSGCWRRPIAACGGSRIVPISAWIERVWRARLLLEYTAHDDLPLTGWLYTPREGSAPFPTVLSFHGGPEGQEQPRYRYEYQALAAQGIAVFAPNVRGSSGFGKRFVNLDNGALRVNAIQDIASTPRLSDRQRPGLAPGRIGIMGGSYGGYMTMAGLTEFPEPVCRRRQHLRLVNFKTFFAQTEPWMASISKIEYGDPETEGDMLDALSPIHKMDRVTAPTLVLHGANDTNVPVYEAEQVVEKLRERGVPVEYILFPDEGHGFRKEGNRLPQRGLQIASCPVVATRHR